MKRNVVEILIAIVDNYIMPLPNRNPKEGKDDFISRCMGDAKMNSEFPESKQRYAVCQRQYSKGEVLEVDSEIVLPVLPPKGWKEVKKKTKK